MRGLTARGTGMFPVANCTNHSCDPNVASVTRHADLTLELVAIKPIAAGDELFISYIDESQPYADRQAQLRREYRFDCRCPRCVAEGQ